MATIPSPEKSGGAGRVLVVLGPLLLAVFAVLFYPLFGSGTAHFANDGPYGTLLARPYQTPDSFRGIWNDLLWLGAWNGNFFPNLTGTSIGVLGPGLYHKAMIPIGLIFLGLSAGVCLNGFRFPRWVCVLGGLAAALNMNVFSNACWGLPSRAHAMGAAFLAIAALHDPTARFQLARIILAGLAIGLGISEAGDNGAIFAIVVGTYGFFRAFAGTGSRASQAARGAGRVALAAIIAAIFAAQTLNIFVNLAVKGVVGMSDNRMSPEQKWDFATQGSLHPKETLRVLIPGLYGYRMDAEDGGNYWGRVGESLAAPGRTRHSGAGEHAGVIVVLIALWAVYQSTRRGTPTVPDGNGTPFTDDERRCVWFWAGTAVVCLLLAWGKWGPLYHVLYALPYFNTIRLPLKWMHPFHLSLLILFAYGLAGMARLHLGQSRTNSVDRAARAPLSGRSVPSRADRPWIVLCAGMVLVAAVGALIYGAGERSLAQHLESAGVLGDPARMAAFSVHEVWWFVVFLLGSAAIVAGIVSGRFPSRSVTGAAIAIAVVMSLDLTRGNRHWMQFFNFEERYALNPPLELLRNEAATYRTAKVPDAPIVHALQSQAQSKQNDPEAIRQLQQHFELFQNIRNYTHEQWQQNQFPYYNIPCLDMSQEPRLPADKLAFNTAMAEAAGRGHYTREYELTSTRHFVGMAGQAEVLNAYLDRDKRRFRDGMRFRLEPTRANSPFFGDLRVRADTNGPYALITFDGALPRARLYSHWEVVTNETDSLSRLSSAGFNPADTVLVHDEFNAPASGTNPVSHGTAQISPITTSHRVDVQVRASTPSILLLTDRFDPAWRATVDGQPTTILRCNYLMRGVPVPAGDHTVAFQYHPNTTGVWMMAGCDGVGLALLAFLGWKRRQA